MPDTPGVSRRGFLVGMGVLGATGAAGLLPQAAG
jgi:hypothetical protein